MEFSNILLSANLAVMSFVAVSLWNQASSAVDEAKRIGALNFDSPFEPPPAFVPSSSSEEEAYGLRESATPKNVSKQSFGALAKTEIGTVNSAGFYFVDPKEGEKDFYSIGLSTTTDKVDAPGRLPECLANSATCTRPNCVRPECRPWGHHYDTIYQQRLGPYSKDNVEPFQFLEIGFFNGFGYDLFREFLPQGECHSIEISCIAEGPRDEGKWPWGNFAEKNPRYQQYLDEDRLHCGDANNIEFLNSIWTRKMNRTDAPPLKVVVDDGAHIAEHMAQTMFFWFPRIQPRGLLIIEDIQPIHEANAFRAQFLPQIMKDLHYCGDPKEEPDEICFPTLFPFLASIHCEMHICVFERNDIPARELSLEESSLPSNALDISKCTSSLNGHW